MTVDKVESQIEQVWEVEQEILDVVHKICMENKLRYSLAYGTLIGAVRHKGFIPWDDDIDLIMPREDYEKLLTIWDQVAPSGYLLQNVRIDPDFTQSFTKIRKDHTTFLQEEFERERHYHKGVFVDIFPGDRVAPGRVSRKLQYVACAVNLLYNRGHTSGSGGIIGMIERILLNVPKRWYPKRRAAAERYIRRWNGDHSLAFFFPSTIDSSRVFYAPDLFENMGTVLFNGKTYQCVSAPEVFLQTQYGDYMQLPPVEERVWKHHPIIIDFEHNYEELCTQK